MLEAIAYIQHQDAVAICRCFGSGEVLEVPGEIAGFPVTGLADHVFAAEASFKLRGERMFLAVQNELTGKWEPGTADTPDPAAAMCAWRRTMTGRDRKDRKGGRVARQRMV